MNYSIIKDKNFTELILTYNHFYDSNIILDAIKKYEINSIIYDYNYNELVDYLPNCIKKLSLAGRFNKPVDNLPIGLEELYLGNFFNHTIDLLPSTLKILSIRDYPPELISNFSYKLDYLPENLERLHLPYTSYFLENFTNLPIGLKEIFIGRDYQFRKELLFKHGNVVKFM